MDEYEYNAAPALVAGDFAARLRHEMDKRAAIGRNGVRDIQIDKNGKVKEHNAITEIKNYWMNNAVFDWCCNHAKKSGVAAAQYAAAFYNTNIEGNTIYFPSAFRASYARQKGLMEGMKSAISVSLQP